MSHVLPALGFKQPPGHVVPFAPAEGPPGSTDPSRPACCRELIARLSSAGAASLALSAMQMAAEEKVEELLPLAEELEKWVKRPAGEEVR